MDKDTQYCRNMCIEHDYDAFVLAQCAPKGARPSLWVSMALAHELERAVFGAAEPQGALLRLGWWRQALSTGERGHPVLRAVAQYPTLPALFEPFLDALEAEISTPHNRYALYGALINIWGALAEMKEDPATSATLAQSYTHVRQRVPHADILAPLKALAPTHRLGRKMRALCLFYLAKPARMARPVPFLGLRVLLLG